MTSTFDVQFVAVTGDSRCPADALCIQGGDALVQIRVSMTVRPQRAGCTQVIPAGEGAVYDSARITLVELQPYPFSSRTIAPDEYRATFTVTR